MGRPILLVDDEIDIREALCETLLCSGYEVTTAPSGHAAAQRLLENEGGVEAVKAIRQVNKGVAIILISGEALTDEVRCGLECGANHFLAKPFALDKLVAFLEKKDACSPVIRTPVGAAEKETSPAGKNRHAFAHWRKRWVEKVRRLPVMTGGMAISLAILCTILAMSSSPPAENIRPSDKQLDRLIRAAALQWAR